MIRLGMSVDGEPLTRCLREVIADTLTSQLSELECHVPLLVTSVRRKKGQLSTDRSASVVSLMSIDSHHFGIT
jgi:hypothetical protein